MYNCTCTRLTWRYALMNNTCDVLSLQLADGLVIFQHEDFNLNQETKCLV